MAVVLNLFTVQSARATSTKSITMEAGVSEALIFKHLIETFDALGYSEPETETEIVLLLIDNLWKGFVSEKLLGENCEKITMLLKRNTNFEF